MMKRKYKQFRWEHQADRSEIMPESWRGKASQASYNTKNSK